MNKRAVFAFFLSLVVIIGYNYLLAQKYPPQKVEEVEQLAYEEKDLLKPALSKPKPEPVKVTRTQNAKDITVETDLVRMVITSNGARIKSCKLKDYPEESINIEAMQDRLTQLKQSLSTALPQATESLERDIGKLEILLEKLAQDGKEAELVSLAATVDQDFSPSIVIPEDQNASSLLDQAVYQCSQDTLLLTDQKPQGRLVFTYKASGKQVTKVYSFSNSRYSIGLDIIFQGWDDQDFPTKSFLVYYGPNIGMPQAERGRRSAGYHGPVTYFQNNQQGWAKKEKYSRKETDTFISREHREGKVGWVGLENKYFLSALIPSLAGEAAIVEKSRFNEHKIAARIPWQGSGEYNFQLYLGPRKETSLKSVGVSLEKTINYGIFDPIARLIYRILMFFSQWTHNFGWAIVLLCLVVKVVFYPLTHHSFESMQKMQHDMRAVQPEMTALREKHKDSPQKLNKEIMELYRRHNINPLASCQSGCLPLLLQMPVFFALYAVLYNSIELRGTPFMGWITDLSAKDPYYVLPVLMGISMFIQQKLTGMGGATGAQQDQAKMMAWMMPLLLTWIFASLPSGVVLYWFTFNLLTSVQQLIIRKKQEATS